MAFEITGHTLKKYEGNEETVILPDGVEIIADYAFSGAHEMREIVIPDTVKEIGTGAFYDCKNLRCAKLPSRLSFLGGSVFARCVSLKKAVLSDALTYLPESAFWQCESLEEVILNEKLEKTGRSCFGRCVSLKRISLPGRMRELGDNTFVGCASLAEAVLNEGLETIGKNAFSGCSSLRELVLPDSLVSIGAGAFETNGRLKLTVPDHIEIRSRMLDSKWNMNWNAGADRRCSGKNEENYQLIDSRIANVNLDEFKPAARDVLALNYLEVYDHEIAYYHEWIEENTEDILELAVKEKRWKALNRALELDLVSVNRLEPYLERITDREEKAKLLVLTRDKPKEDPLSSFSLNDLF